MEIPDSLATPRLRLRRPDPERDAPVMLARWACDPEVTRFILWPPYRPDAVGDASAFLRACADNWDGRVGHRPWMIVPRVAGDDLPVGMVGVTPHGPHSVEVGYVLGRAWWSGGLTTEAVRAVVAAMFEDAAVWRVFAPAHVQNVGSHRVLEKAGLAREGTLRRHIVYANLGPEPQDSALFAITRDDVVARRTAP